jgi:hypothetical protein
MAGDPLYNLEFVGEVVNPLTRPSVILSSDGQLTAIGWAVDRDHKTKAGGVDIAIDDRPYVAEYGLDRADVGEYFKLPEYAKAGFKLSLAAAAIGKGKHRIAVRVISNDAAKYQEGASLVLDIQ